MNKGRNIIIILCCLLLIGVLTFLSRTTGNNSSAVVDGVRYILKGVENNTSNYEFYFTDDTVMTGRLIRDAECATLKISVRGEPIKSEGNIIDYESTDFEYVYKIYGTNKSNSYINWEYSEYISDDLKANKPYEVFSEDVLTSMVFGNEPLISIIQALVIAVFAVIGGLIIGFAEELWHILYKKSEDEDPAWDDMNGIKRVGIGIFVFDAILLILFVIL